MKRTLIALSILLCAAIAVPAVAQKGKGKHRGKGPEVIQLPTGFGPEGITTWKRHTFFVGSRNTGEIYRGSLRTGEGDTFVAGKPQVGEVPDDRAATGMKVDRRGRLFVSGADSKHIRVYDARTGAQLADYEALDAGFINDVIVTRRAAYFTDSQRQYLWVLRFGEGGALPRALDRLTITGDFVVTTGFNLNGIEKARGGQTLIAIKSSTGELFAIDAASGASRRIPVSGGDGELAAGDGLLLKGRRLYVVENQDDRVTVVRLRRNLSEGRIVRQIDSELFEVPTTIARSGGRNYVVNAKFNRPNPDNTFEVVRVPRK